MDDARVGEIAGYLGIPLERFLSRFCYAAQGRWYVGVGRDGFCHFYDPTIKGCAVHPVKPDPCRIWPYFDGIIANRVGFDVARNNCPGFNEDVQYEDFVAYARNLGFSVDERE